MAELTVNQIIKLILGILVVAAVIWGLYSVFTNQLGSFIKNVGTDKVSKLILFLI